MGGGVGGEKAKDLVGELPAAHILEDPIGVDQSREPQEATAVTVIRWEAAGAASKRW